MKRAKETAHNLYSMGMSDEFIAKAVNVSIELVRDWLAIDRPLRYNKAGMMQEEPCHPGKEEF